MDIVSWAESRFGFYVDRHYVGGKWLEDPGPIRLSEYHKRILSHIFRPDSSGRWPYSVVAWAEPAKSGKSAIAGLVAEYVALHGEKNSSIVMASNKQNQAASLMFKSLTDSIEYNPHLPNVEASKYEVTFSNGNMVRAIPSNSKGEAGARFSLALFDELWAYQYEDSLRLWTEFKTDPTRLNSLKMAVGYGGYIGESDLWLNLLESGKAGQPVPELADIVNDDGEPACWANGRVFVFWSHVCRQPWQTPEWLDQQATTNTPAEYNRMFRVEFVPATQKSFTQPEWLDSCFDPAVKSLTAGDQTPVVIALDLSMGGAGADTISMAGVCRWGEQGFATKFIRVYEPTAARFDYDKTAGIDLLWLIQNCNVAQLAFDPYQALHFIKQFNSLVWCEEFSQQNERTLADSSLYDLILSRRLHHDNNPLLRQHILNAGAKSADESRVRLVKVHPKKKIDLAVCVGMASYRASKLNLPPDPVSLSLPARHTPAPPPPAHPIPESANNGPVLAIYRGNSPDGSFMLNGVKVNRGVPIPMQPEQFERLQSTSPAGWWVRANS